MLGAEGEPVDVYLSDEEQNDLSFGGFLGPISNPPYVNTFVRGQRIYITFALGGYRGMRVLEAGYPLSYAADFRTWTRQGVDEAALQHGQLGFSPFTSCYTFLWQTDPAWDAGCRVFVLGLRDGSRHVAHFRFR